MAACGRAQTDITPASNASNVKERMMKDRLKRQVYRLAMRECLLHLHTYTFIGERRAGNI